MSEEQIDTADTAPESPDTDTRGYGNIYTPHAGSMVIHVHRESGLANRTIVLTQRQVRFFRRGLIVGGIILAIGAISWLYLAAQASRVPFLTRRVANLQRDVHRVDTLQTALVELERRFQQVQRMLGASAPAQAITNPALRALNADSIAATQPSLWPLSVAGQVIPHDGGSHPQGIDIAVPVGTPVRAAGAGTVVEVGSDASGGKLVKIRHRDGYESVYANMTDVLVEKNDQVPAGAVIALSGNGGHAPIPHVHFEIRREGASLDPLSLVKPGGTNGDLR
jgi:murein DD-endopeptidase MepM/ murein hydrolase activator NlpD